MISLKDFTFHGTFMEFGLHQNLTTSDSDPPIENNGAKIRTITCIFKCRELISVALDRCGDSIEKIHVQPSEVRDISLDDMSGMLDDISKKNPAALILIKFKNITFTLARARVLQFQNWFEESVAGRKC